MASRNRLRNMRRDAIAEIIKADDVLPDALTLARIPNYAQIEYVFEIEHIKAVIDPRKQAERAG